MTANNVVLITAGHKRIGASISEILHAKGFCVAICHRSGRQEACTLAERLNQIRADSAKAFYADLDDLPSAFALIKQVIAWQGRLDVLVNNASIFLKTNLEQFDEDFNDLFRCNVKAPFALTMAAKPFLEKNKGSVINIADVHASKPLKDYSLYSMSKAALLMQTKSLAKELAPNIRVNAVSPGLIAWPEHANKINPTLQTRLINKTALKRQGNAKNIALAVLSLIENDYLTGIDLPVEGGRIL
jgi:pteridine reductase